jgi:hypothetical protein
MLEKGCSIHPGTLIAAARRGDVDFVRLLHSRGVPLWARASEEKALDTESATTAHSWMLYKVHSCMLRNVMPIPPDPETAKHMRSALKFGWVTGAPLTPAMEELLRADRCSTRAVLLCFHAAAQRSGGEAILEQKAAWAGMHMGRLPIELLEKIIMHAGLEIPESVRRSLPRRPSVAELMPGTTSMWGPYGDMWEYVTPTPPDTSSSV